MLIPKKKKANFEIFETVKVDLLERPDGGYSTLFETHWKPCAVSL